MNNFFKCHYVLCAYVCVRGCRSSYHSFFLSLRIKYICRFRHNTRLSLIFSPQSVWIEYYLIRAIIESRVLFLSDALHFGCHSLPPPLSHNVLLNVLFLTYFSVRTHLVILSIVSQRKIIINNCLPTFRLNCFVWSIHKVTRTGTEITPTEKKRCQKEC